MQAKIYSQEGKETGKIALPESIFNVPWNNDLIHQVIVSMQGNARMHTAHSKDRSEVRGGGRKPWRQKGTGQARHGSRRSPIWRGGGVTFGPRKDKDYSRKINKKMRTKALFTALSKKLKDKELLLVDKFTFAKPKSAEAKKALSSLSYLSGFENLGTKRKNAALLALSNADKNTERSFRNFGNISVLRAQNLNPVDVLTYKYLILDEPKKSIEFLENKIKKASKATAAKS
jgi:large subunit ribosomal protein L4